MSPKTSRKVKASVMIIMLSVAEGHRIQEIVNDSVISQSGGAAHVMAHPAPKEQVKLAAKQLTKPIGDPKLQEQVLDQMMEDLKRQEQLKAEMAMPSLQGQAKQVQEQMAAIKAKPLSLVEASRSNKQECDKTTGESWKAHASPCLMHNPSDPLKSVQAERALFPEVMLTEHMSAMITHPVFKNQAMFLAEQMESMMAVASIQGQATLIAEQMDAMLDEPNSLNHSTRVSELMEAMMNDPKFHEQATRVAKQMSETITLDSEFLDFSKVVSEKMEEIKTGPNAGKETTFIVEQGKTAMSDPNFQEQVNLVLHMVEALTGDPSLQQQAWTLAEQMEAMKDGLNTLKEATHVVKHVEAIMADPSLQAQAQLIAEQMVAGEHMVTMMEHQNFSRQTERVSEQMEATKPEPLALVEVSKSRGQESANSRLLPSTAGALNVKPLSRAPAFPLGRPMLASGRTTMKVWRPLTVALENERGRGPRMSPASLATNTHNSVLTSARGLKTLMPSLIKALSSRNPDPVMSHPLEKKRIPAQASTLICFTLWFMGGFAYNIHNKRIFKATGGGFPMILATLELGVSFIYALVLWLGPDRRQRPNMSFKDYVRTLPIGAAFAGLHIAQMFALSLGAVSFGQIVRNAEPAFAAVIGTCLYGAKISAARWVSLIPVIGGVTLASLGEVDFAMGALVTAALANVFNAIRGNEIEKLLNEPRMSERLGTARNVYAISTINAFLFALPLMLLTEGSYLHLFLPLMTKNPALVNTVAVASTGFILSNEFGTRAIQKMGTVQNAVGKTAVRVVFVVVSALVLRESLGFLKLLGAGVSIGGVFLYSTIEQLLQDRKPKGTTDPLPPQGQTEDTALSIGKPKERGLHALLKKLRPKKPGLAA